MWFSPKSLTQTIRVENKSLTVFKDTLWPMGHDEDNSLIWSHKEDDEEQEDAVFDHIFLKTA